jgi:DnaJ-class molecular chaperone
MVIVRAYRRKGKRRVVAVRRHNRGKGNQAVVFDENCDHKWEERTYEGISVTATYEYCPKCKSERNRKVTQKSATEKDEKCPDCHGNGMDPVDERTCQTCDGTGHIKEKASKGMSL